MAEKQPVKKRSPKGIWTLFEKKGDKIERKNKSCPKCGTGFFMAPHENRNTCGGCGYTEFKKKQI